MFFDRNFIFSILHSSFKNLRQIKLVRKIFQNVDQSLVDKTELNSFFYSIISLIINSIFNAAYMSTDKNEGYEMVYFANLTNHLTLFNRPFTESVTLNCLKTLKPKKTMGSDEIPVFVLHDYARVLLLSVTIIFNLSLRMNTNHGIL